MCVFGGGGQRQKGSHSPIAAHPDFFPLGFAAQMFFVLMYTSEEYIPLSLTLRFAVFILFNIEPPLPNVDALQTDFEVFEILT